MHRFKLHTLSLFCDQHLYHHLLSHPTFSSYFPSPSFTITGLMASLTYRAFPCCNLSGLLGPIPLLV